VTLKPEPDVRALVFILLEVERLTVIKVKIALSLAIQALLLIEVNLDLDSVFDAAHESHAAFMFQNG
jgi:hypothetical protein